MTADVNLGSAPVRVIVAQNAVHRPMVRRDVAGVAYVTNDDRSPTNGSSVSIVNADSSISSGIFSGGRVVRA